MNKKNKPEDNKRIPNNNGNYANRFHFYNHNGNSFNSNTNGISKSINIINNNIVNSGINIINSPEIQKKRNSPQNNKVYNNYNKREIEKREELEKREKQKLEKENEIENNIRDILKCYICLSKVTKPRMCNYCKRICCEECIKKWLEDHNACGICKRQQTLESMITIPFLDDMSAFFINNIDNHAKKSTNIFKSQLPINAFNTKTQIIKPVKNYNNNSINIRNIDNNNNNIINECPMSEINNNTEINEIEEDDHICNEHRKKIDFYCIQCNKYFCGECLIIFSEESKKHTNHYIVKVDSINDLGVTEAINEYNKLPQTKGKYEDLIGLCNMKLKENEIKKYETMKYLNTIKDLYIKKLNEESKSIKNMLKEVKIKKNKILAEIELFPSKYQPLENNNDQNQGQAIIKELKTLNKVDLDLRRQIIIEDSKISSNLYVENYQTEFLDFIIQGSDQRFHNNQILVNHNLTISNYNCNLIMKYIQRKVIILFEIKIDEPYNSPNYPIFQTCIVFKNNKFGLEFINLTNQIISQNVAGQFEMGQNREQLHSLELDTDKFLFLINEDNKICLKIFVNKSFYK